MNYDMGSRIKIGVKAISAVCLVACVFLMTTAFERIDPTCVDEKTPPAGTFNSEVPLAWFKLQLKLVKESPGFSPPVGSRAFGYIGVTLYEAVVPGIETHQSLAGQLNGLTNLPQLESGCEYHWPTVANSALASIVKRLFANAMGANKAAIDKLQAEFAGTFKPSLKAEVFNRSAAHGRAVADAIFIWSLNDGGHEGYLKNFPETYTPPDGPGLWVSTPPEISGALQPYWGSNRPFVLSSGSDCHPGPPPVYSEQSDSPFYYEALQVYNSVKNLSPDQRVIAEFWADDPVETSTPPGHSISILNQILEQKEATLDVAAEAYAKVGIAVTDAFIACWKVKFQYNLQRPITYITNFIDPTWTSPIATPSFPEYTSGHSVQSGAAAQVLTEMFGSIVFTDNTHNSSKFAPRTFSSFLEAADEAAISRLYGGVHYRSAIEKGVVQGKCIGQKVSALKFRK